MGLLKNIGNFFKNRVGKTILLGASVLAAPFTAGASLAIGAALGAFKGSSKKKNLLTSGSIIKEQNSTNTAVSPSENIKINAPTVILNTPVVSDNPPKLIREEVVTSEENGDLIIKQITTPKMTDVTLYGYYSEINKITIPVDNDLDNVVVVPNTYFPYTIQFENHPPSEGIRYISEFVYRTLQVEWSTNLGKVLYTLEDGLTIFPYIKLDWEKFVTKYNTFEVDRLNLDGGVLFGFTIDPVFLLQWLDGPEPTPLLDYSFIVPPAVATVFDFNPPDPEQPIRVKASVSDDPKRNEKLAKLIQAASKVGANVAIAKAALGGIKSIYGNTKDSIDNLQKTAEKLGNKFNDLKAALSKDAINGKISQVKDLIKANLPTPANFKKKFIDLKGKFITRIDPNREARLKKKLARREAKDAGIKTKVKLKDFKLPDFPDIPNIPSIPTLPKRISLNNLNQLPGLGKLPNVSGIIAQGKGIVTGIGNINFSDPLSLLNAPANIINQVSGLAETTTGLLDNLPSSISTTLDSQAAGQSQLNQRFQLPNPEQFSLTQTQLQRNIPVIPTETARTGTTTTAGNNG